MNKRGNESQREKWKKGEKVRDGREKMEVREKKACE